MDEKEIHPSLYAEIKALIEEEKLLRSRLNIGDQYRSIHSRLETLFNDVKQLTLSTHQAVVASDLPLVLSASQQYIYVYLYNARGKTLARWENMLSPQSIEEYSVNRPIYASRAHVESYIRSRINSDEHAGLVMKVEKTDIVPCTGKEVRYDILGQPLLQLKERVLHIENLVSFFHQGRDYQFVQGHFLPQE